MPDFRIDIRGLDAQLAGLKAMQQPYLGRTIRDGAKITAQKVLVPAIRAQLAADIRKRGSHRGNPGGRGRKGPLEKNVTVKTIRTRGNEVMALTVGPRAWWAHFFAKGTRPHLISARVGTARAARRTVRQLNEGRASRAAALFFGGQFATRVQHPGSPPHDSVNTASRRVQRQIAERSTADLLAAYQKAIRTKHP